MVPLELTRARLVSVWWLITWRGVVGGMLIGAVCGMIGGLLAAIIVIVIGGHASPAVLTRAGQIAGAVLTTPFVLLWGIWVVRMALTKRYRDFRLALLPIDVPAA
jgi:hypothetical protein